MQSGIANPYHAAAGPALDTCIHRQFFHGPSTPHAPRYSTEARHAKNLQKEVEARFGVVIRTGRTRINGRNWFARYGTDPSTCTEVLADSYPLAVCRLALVLWHSEGPDGDT